MKKNRVQYEPSLGAFVEDFVCLYCNGFRTKIKAEYERHVVTKHPNHLCYPGVADMVSKQFKFKKERPRDVVSMLNEDIRKRNREKENTNVSSSVTISGELKI